MFYVNTIILVVLHAILLFTGSAGSLFILVVQFLDWLKTHQLDPIDFIIVFIGLANLFLQGSFSFNAICIFQFVEFYVQVWVVNSLAVIMTSLALSSLWSSTTLCFYYCVKIINLKGTMLYKLKAKLPIIVPWLLVLSNVASWAVALPTYWDVYRLSPVPTDNATHIQPTYNLNFKSRCDCVFDIFMVYSGVAFMIILFTAGAIIKSLLKHVMEIKKNNKGVRPARISAHISAARTVFSLLIVYLIFYAAINAIFNEVGDVGSAFFSVIFIMACTFPTANAVILIFGNRKLSNKLRYILGVKLVSGNTEVCVTV
ncbi:taste receptor type 2 member 40-like [Leptodactylus fuscus]|uniref:taste receptor type 2 member 40-like n=1 Tax=Leptodactylus fuscus TaxID=238119 RepID=UPI003F4E4E1F